MTNKTTKSALLTSSISLLLCFAMLLGTTFAWFTDSAVSGNNIIKAGNLDMKLSYKPYGAENTEWKEVKEDTVLFGEDALYEPGYTEAVWLKVENLGSLAFRYDLAINVANEKQGTNKAGEKFSLSDHLEVKYMTTTSTDMESDFYTTRESLDSFAWGSAANSGVASLKDKIAVINNGVAFSKDDAANGAYNSAYVLVVISMPTTVGNEANHNENDIPEIDFTLTAVATQLTYEKDSFGTDYDKDAIYPVTNADALKNIITDDEVTNAKIDLANGNYDTNFKVDGGKNLTIEGNGKDTVLSGQIATTSSNEGTLILKNMTIKVDDSIADSTGISQTGKSAIAIWGNQTVICENVTFDMSLKDSTAITSWWDTGVGTTIIVRNCTFNCNGQRPIRATGNVTVENCTFNDPYRYAVQLTAKSSTATEMNKAIINFKNNTIVNGESGKAFVYGIQLEGSDYGCHDCVINGSGNTIVDGGADSTMYYCECGKVDHNTIEWNVETTPVHEV